MFDLSKIKSDTKVIQNQLSSMNTNKINGMDLSEYIFNKVLTKMDPIK